MGNIFSYGGFARRETVSWEDVIKDIDNVNHKDLIFLWAFKEDDEVKHTSMVMQFGLTPKYSLDYEGEVVGFRPTTQDTSLQVSDKMLSYDFSPNAKENTRRPVEILTIMDVVKLHFFSGNTVIRGILAELSIESSEKKKAAKEVCQAIKNLNTNNYYLKKYNCRTYIQMVVKQVFIPKGIMDNQQQEEFDKGIGQLLKNHKKVFSEFTKSD